MLVGRNGDGGVCWCVGGWFCIVCCCGCDCCVGCEGGVEIVSEDDMVVAVVEENVTVLEVRCEGEGEDERRWDCLRWISRSSGVRWVVCDI